MHTASARTRRPATERPRHEDQGRVQRERPPGFRTSTPNSQLTSLINVEISQFKTTSFTPVNTYTWEMLVSYVFLSFTNIWQRLNLLMLIKQGLRVCFIRWIKLLQANNLLYFFIDNNATFLTLYTLSGKSKYINVYWWRGDTSKYQCCEFDQFSDFNYEFKKWMNISKAFSSLCLLSFTNFWQHLNFIIRNVSF